MQAMFLVTCKTSDDSAHVSSEYTSHLASRQDISAWIVKRASALQAMRWSDGSYLEDQDHWWLSGIHRDVFLLAKPLTFISDYRVRTPLTFAAKGSSRLASARQARYMRLHCARKQRILPRHE